MSDRPAGEILLDAASKGMPGLHRLQKLTQQEGLKAEDFWLGVRSWLLGLVSLERSKDHPVDDLCLLISKIDNVLMIAQPN